MPHVEVTFGECNTALRWLPRALISLTPDGRRQQAAVFPHRHHLSHHTPTTSSNSDSQRLLILAHPKSPTHQGLLRGEGNEIQGEDPQK